MLLLIDTSTDKASVCLASNGTLIAEHVDLVQTNHAAFLQPAIKKILAENSVLLKDIQAIAVMAGPGSYTGLRVGMASAKGLCYALQIPLITINTLEVMATTLLASMDEADRKHTLLCPMIDARRMEVFTAVYNADMIEVVKPCAMVIEPNSFVDLIRQHRFFITGNGAEKIKPVLEHQNLFFDEIKNLNPTFALLADSKFRSEIFSSLAYTEPLYLKGIYVQGK